MDGLRRQRRGRRGRGRGVGTAAERPRQGHAGLARRALWRPLPDRSRRRGVMRPPAPPRQADVRRIGLGAGLQQLLHSTAAVCAPACSEGVRLPLPREHVSPDAPLGGAVARVGRRPEGGRLHRLLAVGTPSIDGGQVSGPPDLARGQRSEPCGGQDPYGSQAPDPRSHHWPRAPPHRRLPLRGPLPALERADVPACPAARPGRPGRAARGGGATAQRLAGSIGCPQRDGRRGAGGRARAARGAAQRGLSRSAGARRTPWMGGGDA
mmetsp:Transcript_48003/g.148168  ORF Transcript_48003/g.148168 Transcript_48003/m.148168 type:complete len:266 (+) Transcript_48003:1689-2486(+)